MLEEKQQITPRAFISYSWTSPEHEQRVLDLAERLVSDGVDILLDKWELREEQDKFAFMERMVTDPSVSKVVTICDALYARKANEREGGVGTESQIISKEIYEKVDQRKFIPVVTEYDDKGKACVPAFFGSRIHVDMSSPEKTAENYEQLLRAIFDKPLYRKPALGSPPAHLFDSTAFSSKTRSKCVFWHCVNTDSDLS